MIVGLVVIGLLMLTITTYTVDGESMSPTFSVNDWVLVSMVPTSISSPARGDMLVFYSPINANEKLLKRIIGLPHETIVLQDGQLYIDGERLIEQYTTIGCADVDCDNRIWQLAENEYFLMGDNRDISIDSRSFGAISREHIVGKVIYTLPTFPSDKKHKNGLQ